MENYDGYHMTEYEFEGVEALYLYIKHSSDYFKGEESKPTSTVFDKIPWKSPPPYDNM